MRLRLFQIIQRAQDGDEVSRWYDFFIVTVAFLSIVPLMFKEQDTTPVLNMIMTGLDIVTVYILFADYIFRWITNDIRTGDGIKAFFIYPFTPMAIIDLISILPSITILHNGFKFLRVLRIVRIFRMFKGLTIVTNVFIRERRILLSVVFFILVYIFTVGLIMFTVEPSTFNSFLDALYWSTTALATIGYGDIYPVTDLGKFFATISSVVGICVVAFPAGIITGGYITQLNRAKKEGIEYFSLPVKHDKSFKGKPISRYKSLKSYFKQNKKVRVYLYFMCVCLVLTFLFSVLDYLLGSFVMLDEIAVVLCSIILEPTAGIFIGMINDLVYAININNAGGILFFGVTALYAVVFGVFCRRGREITPKTVIGIFVVTVVFSAIYDGLVSLAIFYTETPTIISVGSSRIASFAQTFNIDSVSGYILFDFISRVLRTFFAFIAVVLTRKFIYDSRFDPYKYFPKTRRYNHKIYRRRKNEHSYIRTWLEENPDENDDLDAALKQGKKSIEQSKKKIRVKKAEVQEMQQQVQEQIEEIEQVKEEIAKHETDIDVKKKAVRKVKRKQAVDYIKPGE